MLNHNLIGDSCSEDLIVFLHEGLGCVKMWRDYPDKVCQAIGFQGLVYDRAGYGLSAGNLSNRKPDYLHLAVDELYALLVELKLTSKSIILYGHSDGGSIALLFAAKYPNLVKKVITEAAHVFVEDETLAGIKPAVEAFNNGKLEGLKKYHGDRYREVFFAWVDIWNAPNFRNWNIESDIKNINCPQLIIQGEDDQYGTFKQVYAIQKNTNGLTTLFLPKKCGHAPFKEQQLAVLNQVVTFLK